MRLNESIQAREETVQKRAFSLAYTVYVLIALFALLCLTFFAPRAAFADSAPGIDGETAPEELPVAEETAKLMTALSEGEDTADDSTPLLVVVVGFDNIAYDNDINWAERIFSDPYGVSAYYTDMSLGSFTFKPAKETSAFGGPGGTSSNTNSFDVTNDGVVHITLNRSHEAWLLQGDSDLITVTQAVVDAIEQSSEFVDYARYDTNSDGEISPDELALAFVFAGYEAAATAGATPLGEDLYLWSFAWSVQDAIEELDLPESVVSTPVIDGVRVSSYIATAEKLDASNPNQLGLLTHELGHYLGLPDLYDTGEGDGPWTSWKVDKLSVMDQGAWSRLSDGTYRPAALDAWSRVQLGWVEPTILSEGNTASVIAQFGRDGSEGAYNVIKVLTENEGEYYLIENRQFAKWDAGLAGEYGASEGGIVIWHVDENIYEAYTEDQAVNNSEHHPAIMPLYVEFDGDSYSMIGARPYTWEGVFTKSHWNSNFADEAGSYIKLPLYAASDDEPQDRRLQCLSIEILDNAQMSMRVRLVEDHDWGEWTTTIEPTITSPGERMRVCKNDPDHVEYEEIPPLEEPSPDERIPEEPKQDEPRQDESPDMSKQDEMSVQPDVTETTHTTYRKAVAIPATGDANITAPATTLACCAALFVGVGRYSRIRKSCYE